MFNYPYYYNNRLFPFVRKNPQIVPNQSVLPTKEECPKETENNCNNEKKPNNQDFLFELFGLKIYTDDILILSLLFLMYTENVKDDFLFIILILLLIG